DPIERAQYLDFLRNRTFRRSLLCRAGRPIDRTVRPERLRGLWLASAMKPERASADLATDSVEAFTGPGGLRLSIGHPWLKTAFGMLGRRWPAGLPFGELMAQVAGTLGAEPGQGELQEILETLLHCHRGSVLELRPRANVAVALPGVRPVASPLARWMARSTHLVTNLRHELVELREVDRLLLGLLDGARDRTALALGLRRAASSGGIELAGGPEAAVAEGLAVLAMSSLLVSAGE
ncbi:MAG: hypothetical protein FJX72_14255, partial [Armatimonadetes bacterium]|nr:hypothetical protein [Armatimonadota bacterium]